MASEKRLPGYPDLPTFAESGVPYTANTWAMVLAPAKTPKDVVARINAEAIKVINGIVKTGDIPKGTKPNQFTSAADNYGYALGIMKKDGTKKAMKDIWTTEPFYTLWGWWLVQPSDRRIVICEGEIDAMVCGASLREVVGTDALGAVAAADQALALRGLGALLRAHLGVVEARGQHRHRLGLVAVLRAVVLALDDDAGRNVGDAHRRVGLVDVLAAGAGGAEGVDAQVGRVEIDVLDLVDFRHHRHGARRGVDAALGFGHRHALHTVAAGFELEPLIDTVAADAGDDWAMKERDTLGTKSPQTCKVALRQLAESAALTDFADNMRMEYRIASRVLTRPDFAEGVRAVIVDKTNDPKWDPATPEGVTEDLLDVIFAPLPEGEEWVPLPN